MKYFPTDEIGRIFVVRLDPGDYVLESIVDFLQKENVKDAFVASAIGTLDRCKLHMVTTTGYPPKEHFEYWENKPLEMASVNGVVANGKPHLHVVVSDSEKAYAGHLEQGCRVLYLAEIVIVEVRSMNLARVRDDKDILRLTRSSQDST